MAQFDKVKSHLLDTQYTWLVTGVAGFIGSNLLETLLKLNQKVIGLDNFDTGKQSKIDAALDAVSDLQRNNFTFYHGDIRDLSVCEKATQNVDFVLHQAALGSIQRSIENLQLVNEVNISGFLNVLIAAKSANVKRFIYASSSSVYGDSPQLPKVEAHIGNPLSPYAVSKCANELYAKAFVNCYDIDTIGLRYFNVFGPRQDHDGSYAPIIPRWINDLINNKDVHIYGDGETSRDFCYIENVVQANILAAMTTTPNALNTVYNVAVGEQTTLNHLYGMICQNLKINKKPIYNEFRKGDIRHSLADISKAKDLLGYQPTHTAEVGLSKMISLYQKTNPKNYVTTE